MLEEIKKFRDLVITWLVLFLFGGVFFFFFGMSTVSIFGKTIQLPLLTENSFSIEFFKMMKTDILPSSVTLVATGPLSALNTQTAIAFLLSFFVTFPYLIYRLVKYISPALYGNERRALLSVLLPACLLFFGGAVFSYVYVIPPTFKALYVYTTATGVTPYFSMEAFVSSVFTFMLVAGISFLLPIFMILLSFLGIVSSSFWWKYWRYAQLSFLIFSAIITPDGSGVSMMLLSLPLTLLYVAGAAISGRGKKETTEEYIELPYTDNEE
jgi:sec-independent protein translocase protein TatC